MKGSSNRGNRCYAGGGCARGFPGALSLLSTTLSLELMCPVDMFPPWRMRNVPLPRTSHFSVSSPLVLSTCAVRRPGLWAGSLRSAVQVLLGLILAGGRQWCLGAPAPGCPALRRAGWHRPNPSASRFSPAPGTALPISRNHFFLGCPWGCGKELGSLGTQVCIALTTGCGGRRSELMLLLNELIFPKHLKQCGTGASAINLVCVNKSPRPRLCWSAACGGRG